MLRAELKRLRVHAGLTQADVAWAMDWSPSKLIRIERGDVNISMVDVRALLTHYGVRDQHLLAKLLEMVRGASQASRFAEYSDLLPTATSWFFEHEATASIIRQLALNAVPDLLQTDEYAQALLTVRKITSADVDKVVKSLKERQVLFDQPRPPESYFILDESVLRRSVGGSRVMKRQIDHLLIMATRPTVYLQILPFSVGAHPGLDQPFTHLEFPAEHEWDDVVFIGSTLGGTLIHNDVDKVAAYREQFYELEDIATPRGAFHRLVRPDSPSGAS